MKYRGVTDGTGGISWTEPDKRQRYIERFPRGTMLYESLKKHEPTVSDGLRKWYFDHIAGTIQNDYGTAKEDFHEQMKWRFALVEDLVTGLSYPQSVFSNNSKMPISEKKQFISDVRYWVMDWFEIDLPDPNF